MIHKLVEHLRKTVQESSIDFPHSTLCAEIWEKDGDSYLLRGDVKAKIIALIQQYPGRKLLDSSLVQGLHLTGSIGTNQYFDDTDLDIHLILNQKNLESNFDSVDDREAFIKEVFKWSEENGLNLVGKHPAEIYLQVNPQQELMSDAVYDLLYDTWTVGPKILPSTYNPYDDFSHILGAVESSAQKADLGLGQLKRRVVDYETVKTALSHLDKAGKQKALSLLQQKLQAIEDEIEQLSLLKKKWSDMRKAYSNPQAFVNKLSYQELVKKWRDVNAVFKFLDRYKYLQVVTDLQELIEDEDGLEKSEVKDVKKILKSTVV